MTRSLKLTSLFAAALALAGGQSASANYVQIFSASAANSASVPSGFLDTVVVSGSTAYALTRNSTTAVGGALTAFNGGSFSTVMAPSQWVSTAVDPTGSQGAAIVGGVFRTTNFFSQSAWEINLGAGTPTEVILKASIDAVTTGSASLPAQFEVTASGEIFAYNATSNNRLILQVSPSNTIAVEIPVATWPSLFGAGNPNATINGLGVAGTTLYLGSNSSDTIVAWDTAANTGAVALSTANITAVTGSATAGFGDILGAPNGLVYFRESVSDSILSFNPANPAGTLATVLTGAQLGAGPGTTNVAQLGWWGGNLAWTVQGNAATSGFFAIPEPASALMAVVALAGLGARRRG
ncbi:MAG: hypothetical protein ACRCT8_00060 [Lacipirellulaceae bacterium]